MSSSLRAATLPAASLRPRAPPARRAPLRAVGLPSSSSSRSAGLPPPIAASSAPSSAPSSSSRAAAAARTVADVMTRAVVTVRPETTLDEALELMVSKRITGLPVVDADGAVVGVVSDFDLLPLDVSIDSDPASTFPAPGADWAPFLATKAAAAKSAGTTVADVMTPEPVVVGGDLPLSAGARTLLATRVGRLPVVDGAGRLIGLFSRSDVIRAAWEGRKAGRCEM